MEDGDNVGGANNDVGGGASSGAAADPSTPSDGAAAAAGGGGVVRNSSPVVVDDNGLTATTQTAHSENGTLVTVKIVKTAASNRAKKSWIWQEVMHELKPSINGENVICSACKHLMSWLSRSGTTGMTQHYGKKHPALYAQIMKHTTPANAKANVSAAIGKLIVVYCLLVL